MSKPHDAPEAAAGGRAPLIGPAGAALALVVALALCWPIWVTGAAFTSADTRSYLRGGQTIWAVAGDVLFRAAPGPVGAPDGAAAGPVSPAGVVADEKGEAAVGRSLTYSAAAYALYAALGTPAIAVAQTWLTVFVALSLLTAQALRRPAPLLAGGLWLALLTPLPFFAAYLAPDLLAAVPILFAACLVWRWTSLTTAQKAVLTGLAALAASSHYGTVPLALGCVLGAMALVALDGRTPRLGMIAAAVAVVGFGPVFNLGASSATLDRASSAPLRLPILLARSIDDGPALWYLREHCPSAALATCAVFDGDIPDNAGSFLWSNQGIADATPEEMAQVRDEEWAILAGAFLAYPAAQTSSLLRNAARQLVLVGLGGIVPEEGLDDRLQPVEAGPAAESGRALRDRFGGLVPWGTWGAILASGAVAALARPGRREALAVLAAVGGLVVNAAIFGGLSAPVERYQARVIWVLPFVLLAVAAHARAAPAAPSGAPARPAGAAP